MTISPASSLHLQADTETVEDLVALVRKGVVRVPEFQRPLRWKSEDVKLLFDSIYHGYPIGSFLMRKAKASAETIHYGPVEVVAPATHGALWVVDGQQRLTALTAALARPVPIPRTPDDEWVLYFDAAKGTFEVPPRSGDVPSGWVPVAELLDASTLTEWVFGWSHKDDAQLRRTVFDAGARIRQYEIPLYVVETDDERPLREIFFRINNSGAALKWEEVHDALFGRKSEHPSTLDDLAEDLQTLGAGRPENDQLLSALVAFRGLDVTRSISEHYRRDPEVLRNGVRDALPALRSVLSFLKAHAEIPHLRLLPRSLPLVVLARFFGLYPEPKTRTVELLVRWTWRTLLSVATFDERTVLRHSVNAIQRDDEEESVQRLLGVIPHTKQADFVLPRRFDARAAESRIALVALSSLRPRRLTDGKILNVAELIEEHDVEAFRKIIPSQISAAQSPANRLLLSGVGSARKELVEVIRRGDEVSGILRSHAIDRASAADLMQNEMERFLGRRTVAVEEAVRALDDRLAGWSKSDRPSVGHVLNSVEESE